MGILLDLQHVTDSLSLLSTCEGLYILSPLERRRVYCIRYSALR